MPVSESFSPGAPAPVAAPAGEHDRDAARHVGPALGVAGGVEAGAPVELVGPGAAAQHVVARTAEEVVGRRVGDAVEEESSPARPLAVSSSPAPSMVSLPPSEPVIVSLPGPPLIEVGSRRRC